jgi:tetratricopeptide (TPR) repeat protein
MPEPIRHFPEVLAVRLEIYKALQKWELAQVVAKKLVEYEPEKDHRWIAWAYATRQAQSLEAAKVILLKALEKLPKEPQIHYQLACCQCQLGDLTAAKKHLDKTFRLDPKYRVLALDDKDLLPLWMVIDED